MNVLSLFDGMSCGRITLSELGIPVKKILCVRSGQVCHKGNHAELS
jgi:hypothetical protein